MKTLLTLLVSALLLGVTVSLKLRARPEVTPVSRPLVALPPPLQASPPVRRLAQSTEAGHVADILVWSTGRVVKGQVLARLSVPVSTPALQQAQRTFAQAKARYDAQPTAEQYRTLESARAQLAQVPRLVRNGYVVAPVTGRLVRSLLVNGQYLPRAGTVAIIEVPAKEVGMTAPKMVVMR